MAQQPPSNKGRQKHHVASHNTNVVVAVNLSSANRRYTNQGQSGFGFDRTAIDRRPNSSWAGFQTDDCRGCNRTGSNQSKIRSSKGPQIDFRIVELVKLDDNRYLLEGTGRYSVEVTTFDPDTGIDGAQIEVVLGEPTKPDDPPPKDPPPPTGTFDDIKTVSATGSAAVRDPTTASRLATSLRAVVPTVRVAADLPSAQATVVNAIENTLLTRVGESRNRDWLGLWRRPLNTAIESAKQSGRIKTAADYAAVVEAMAAGLQPTSQGTK